MNKRKSLVGLGILLFAGQMLMRYATDWLPSLRILWEVLRTNMFVGMVGILANYFRRSAGKAEIIGTKKQVLAGMAIVTAMTVVFELFRLTKPTPTMQLLFIFAVVVVIVVILLIRKKLKAPKA